MEGENKVKKKRGRKPNITKNTKNIKNIEIEECYVIQINNEDTRRT